MFIYWTNRDSNAIYRSNVNGSQITKLFDGLDIGTPTGLALHENTLYWTDSKGNAIYKGNADGSGTPTILFAGTSALDRPSGLFHKDNALYWTNEDSNSIYTGNIDGSGTPVKLFSGSPEVDNSFSVILDNSTQTIQPESEFDNNRFKLLRKQQNDRINTRNANS
ncbi:MAG: hypothetical protein H6850_02020 [Alphaproteobacteria bacterium]|nr:MAG: hypothetical protein H6850_02020 [Alphaproteobacteria bacterium]